MDNLYTINPQAIKLKINEIIRILNRLEPVAGSGISISKHSCGTVFSARTGASGGFGGGGDEYDGPFTVELVMENDRESIICHLGDDEKAAIAGYIRVGSLLKTVEVCTWEPKEGTVYAEVLYEDDNEGGGAFTFGVYFESELPRDSDPKRWILRIAEVSRDGGSWKVSQIWTGGDVTVSGRWVK